MMYWERETSRGSGAGQCTLAVYSRSWWRDSGPPLSLPLSPHVHKVTTLQSCLMMAGQFQGFTACCPPPSYPPMYFLSTSLGLTCCRSLEGSLQVKVFRQVIITEILSWQSPDTATVVLWPPRSVRLSVSDKSRHKTNCQATKHKYENNEWIFCCCFHQTKI